MANEKDAAPVWPKISEAEWYFLAILATIFTLVAAVFAAAWVFSEPELARRTQMVSTLAPFGTLPIALITFCTVAWRGMVSSRQANEQTRANDAKDEENVAKLMLDATKLLGEPSQTSRLSGIAALGTIAMSKHELFAVHCMNMLADQAIVSNADHDDANIFRAALSGLSAGSKLGRMAKRQLKIDFTKRKTKFELIEGVETVVYTHALLNSDDWDSLNRLTDTMSIRLLRCQIVDATIGETKVDAIGCKFDNCLVKLMRVRQVAHNIFSECNFTDAIFRFDPAKYRAAFVNMNHYYEYGRPPHLPAGVRTNLSEIGIVQHPHIEFDDLGDDDI